jgi:hypothetical protein
MNTIDFTLNVGKQMAFEHEVAYLTAKIDVEPPDAPKSIGTGFFYYAPLHDGTDKSLILLISNRHVFVNPKSRLIVSLNRSNEDNRPAFGNIQTFDQIGFENAYYDHPHPEVDLACISVSVLGEMAVFTRWLDASFLQPIPYEQVAMGSDIIFVGYPQGFYDVANNLPLLRKGVIASVPDVDFNGRGEIVIDAQIFPGSSGSPVFVGVEDRYLLLGVISEAVTSNSELQILPTNMPRVGVEQVIGLGIVVKQKHVQELIDYAVEQHIRRKSARS